MLKATIAITFVFTSFAVSASAQNDVNPAPHLTQENLDHWVDFLHPSEQELLWQKVRWHKDYETAVKEARQLKRPILLWTMNGHPCGET